jgi:hypothetical protein
MAGDGSQPLLRRREREEGEGRRGKGERQQWLVMGPSPC